MRKFLLVMVGSLALVYGCSDQAEDTDTVEENVETKTDTNEPAENTTEQNEITLEVIQQYSEEIGDLEAYYINENVNESKSEQDIDLTITSVEYGKVLLNDISSSIYEDLKDTDGKVTYVKLGMEISGDEAQLEKHTFFPYQGEITLTTGETVASESSFSDLVSISKNTNQEVPSGYVYFLTKADMPIEEITFTASAPYDNETMDSVSDDYNIEIKLEHEQQN